MILLTILEFISLLCIENGNEHQQYTKIVINTDYKIVYTSYPGRIKYYKDEVKVYKDSIVIDSITYKKINKKM